MFFQKPDKHGHKDKEEAVPAEKALLLAPDNEIDEDIESPTIDSPVPSASNTPARKKTEEKPPQPVDIINEPNPGANDLLDMSNTIEMTTTKK